MSADNGVYVAEFQTFDSGRKEWRVAYGSDSVVNDLFAPFMTQAEKQDEICRMFGGKVYGDFISAMYAANIEEQNICTEYGVVNIQFDFCYGDLPPFIPMPKIPDGACEHCSSPGGTTVFHGEGNWSDCRNPNLPCNILVRELRNEFGRGINEHVIARTVLEILSAHKLIDPTVEKNAH